MLDMNLKMESEIMRGVEGWTVGESVFKTRWQPYHMLPRTSRWLEGDSSLPFFSKSKDWAAEAAAAVGVAAPTAK